TNVPFIDHEQSSLTVLRFCRPVFHLTQPSHGIKSPTAIHTSASTPALLVWAFPLKVCVCACVCVCVCECVCVCVCLNTYVGGYIGVRTAFSARHLVEEQNNDVGSLLIYAKGDDQ